MHVLIPVVGVGRRLRSYHASQPGSPVGRGYAFGVEWANIKAVNRKDGWDAYEGTNNEACIIC